jgi:putative heme-binding domain-containing protein
MLSSSQPLLKETALWMVDRHPAWGDSLADYLRSQLMNTEQTEASRSEVAVLLTRFAGTASIQELMSKGARLDDKAPHSSAIRRTSLSCMSKSGLKQLPASWATTLAQIMTGSNADSTEKSLAVAVVRAVPVAKGGIAELTQALHSVAQAETLPAELRVESMAAWPAGEGIEQSSQFNLLLQSLGEQASVAARSAAVEAILKLKLNSVQQSALAKTISSVGPLELNRLLGAFENCTDESVGRTLVEALKQSPLLTSLRVDSVKQRLSKFPASIQADADVLYSAINVESGRQKERLDQLTTTLGQGDIRRGQLVFQSSKAACSACHAIGYLGGTIGPDLSRIGKIRTERDLLESLLFPSVSFVRSYEPVLIETKSGKQFNGLIRRESAEDITLVVNAKEEARIARDEIEEIRPGTVSIMPAGLDTQLTPEQLADLIAFLKSRQ